MPRSHADGRGLASVREASFSSMMPALFTTASRSAARTVSTAVLMEAGHRDVRDDRLDAPALRPPPLPRRQGRGTRYTTTPSRRASASTTAAADAARAAGDQYSRWRQPVAPLDLRRLGRAEALRQRIVREPIRRRHGTRRPALLRPASASSKATQ